MSLADIHGRLSVTAAIFTFVMGAWGIVLFARNRGVDGNYLGAIVVGELLLVAQAALGAILLFQTGGLVSLRWVHILYGVLAALIWPFIFTYTRETPQRAVPPRLESILFGAGSLFLWGLVMRAIATAVAVGPAG